MRIWIGIDPGKHGSISAINENSEIIHQARPPLIKDGKKKEIDIGQLLDLIDRIRSKGETEKVIIEKAQAMPRQGVTSMFSIGKGYGIYLGILTALCLPYEEVSPQTWTKVMLKNTEGEGKERCYYRAKQLFLQFKPLTKYMEDWADSLLLAEYGRIKD